MKSIHKALIVVVLSFSMFSCEGKFPEKIGFYKIDYSGNSYVVLLSEDNTYLIHGHITKYVYDDAFILIEQNPIDKICECNHECFEKMKSYNDGRHSVKRCKEAIAKNKVRKYWIVKQLKDTSSTYTYKKHFRKMEKKVFGPFSYNEFKQKRTVFGVSDILELNLDELDL